MKSVSELLTPEEYDAHINRGTFRLAFVGMSNAGKSYRSRVLRDECDFFWYHVDEHIQRDLGFTTMDGISEWMGQPGSDDYELRERRYLESEEKCTKLSSFDTNGKSLVFDTTGSVVYLSPSTLEWLHSECLIVNIDIGSDVVKTMIEKYFVHPKPVIWGNSFSPKAGEDTTDTLKRCYPTLLKERQKRYRALAHLTIPFTEFYDQSGPQTLEVIRSYLDTNYEHNSSI